MVSNGTRLPVRLGGRKSEGRSTKRESHRSLILRPPVCVLNGLAWALPGIRVDPRTRWLRAMEGEGAALPKAARQAFLEEGHLVSEWNTEKDPDHGERVG